MTALSEYQRLEASGLWRARPEDQRRDVIVSLGDATLTMSDTRDVALAHWSLAAVARASAKGKRPAVFHPDGDPGETLELGDDAAEMIAAIERLRGAIERRRPRPGRLRFGLIGGVFAVLGALAIFWLPDALLRQTVQVVPAVKRTEIGTALFDAMTRVTGQPCATPGGTAALAALAQRLNVSSGRIEVVRGGTQRAIALPGGTIVLDHALVEDWEDADVPAGYVIEAQTRAALDDPLRALLSHSGLLASLKLLTTGELGTETLADYAETLVTTQAPEVPQEALLRGFETAEVHSTPYAYARDVTGETVLGLIEADPMRGRDPAPVLRDRDWVRLQGICGG